MSVEDIIQKLKDKFPHSEIILDNELPVEPFVVISALELPQICKFLRDDESLLFDTLMNLSGVDDNNATKVKDEEGNEKLEGRTLSVYYHLHSMKLDHKLALKVSVPIEKPEVESVESIWKCADWHEREAFDMYGIIFLNHPNLIRILMPYDWEEGSYPLRKDFETPEFYNGMKIPY
ncbi:MAG: NADH-quinone oxidoreductase subunit C [Ignavibacteriales bacterium]|nr:NADH-quinone oxidoreductase subunit C [Ignavibacteriales bacterium]MCB9219962.1 NADH-quinone oxidoreductase subunit C [Ignavibacteriales bacterium]